MNRSATDLMTRCWVARIFVVVEYLIFLDPSSIHTNPNTTVVRGGYDTHSLDACPSLGAACSGCAGHCPAAARQRDRSQGGRDILAPLWLFTIILTQRILSSSMTMVWPPRASRRIAWFLVDVCTRSDVKDAAARGGERVFVSLCSQFLLLFHHTQLSDLFSFFLRLFERLNVP